MYFETFLANNAFNSKKIFSRGCKFTKKLICSFQIKIL